MPEPLTILLSGHHEDDLPAAIQQIAPNSRILTKADLDARPEALAEVDIVLGSLKPERFAQARRLKWLQSTSAGAEWVQTPAVQAHPAVITNARIYAVQIAEHLFGMLLMMTRGLDKAVRWQERHEWKRPEVAELVSLPGMKLCVLGLGVIGRRCAELGKAHGMKVVGVRRGGGAVAGVEKVYPAESMKEAMSGANVVMNLLPGVAATRKMVGAEHFDEMADGGFYLSAGRGQTTDTDALIAALRSGKLAGAGLDVTDPEPLPAEHPLWDAPGVIISAHYGGTVGDWFTHAREIFLRNLKHFVAGEPLEAVVDKSEGY